MKKHIFLLILFSINNYELKCQLIFNSLEQVLSYTKEKSSSIKSNSIKIEQAEKGKLAAIASIIDLNGNVSLNVNQNTRLPVSLFPAEAFGGTPGTYQEIQTGIPFTNNLSQYGELKLINISGWKSLKLAKINLDYSKTESQLNEKQLFENIAATYYNIITLNEQLKTTKLNVQASDTIYQIVENKFNSGLARQQDLNEAKANSISIKENETQISFLIEQHYIALKILIDIDSQEIIEINEKPLLDKSTENPQFLENRLTYNSMFAKEMLATHTYKQNKSNLLPTLSFFASNSNQQFSSNFSLFDRNVNWINSNYIGLKATWSIPNANTISQLTKSKYEYLLAKENRKHSEIQIKNNSKQLESEFNKAISKRESDRILNELKRDTYIKNKENYIEGILSLDQLLNSYNAMVNSQYNYSTSSVNVLLSISKININNNYQ